MVEREGSGESGQNRGTGGGVVPPGANRFPAALKHLLTPVSRNGVRFHVRQFSRTEG